MEPKEERLLRDIRNSLSVISNTLIKLELHARRATQQMTESPLFKENDSNGS